MKNPLYIISYDLSNPGRNYEALLKAIKQNRAWARIGQSAYLVVTAETASELRDSLTKVLDANDKIYVSLLGSSAAWIGLSEDVSNWIKNNQA